MIVFFIDGYTKWEAIIIIKRPHPIWCTRNPTSLPIFYCKNI